MKLNISLKNILKRTSRQVFVLITLFISLHVYGQKQWSRDIEQSVFVPKGQWITGVSVSYSVSNQDHYQFIVFENINGDTYSFKVSPMVMYCFKDNLAAGARIAYSRSRTSLDGASVVLGSDTNYDIENLFSISQDWYGTAAFRNYINLGNSTRFGLFNECQIQVGGGQSKLVSGVGESLSGTYEKNVSLNIGLSPGLVMFLNNYSAIEVNVGVLGFNYSHTRSTTDQIYIANRSTKSANFKVNLFSIMFGATFYL